MHSVLKLVLLYTKADGWWVGRGGRDRGRGEWRWGQTQEVVEFRIADGLLSVSLGAVDEVLHSGGDVLTLVVQSKRESEGRRGVGRGAYK